MLFPIYYALARRSWCKSQDKKILDLSDFNMLACVTCTSQFARQNGLWRNIRWSVVHRPSPTGKNNRTLGPCENLVNSTGMGRKKCRLYFNDQHCRANWLVSRAQANLPGKMTCGKYKVDGCSPSTTCLPEPLVLVGTC